MGRTVIRHGSCTTRSDNGVTVLMMRNGRRVGRLIEKPTSSVPTFDIGHRVVIYIFVHGLVGEMARETRAVGPRVKSNHQNLNKSRLASRRVHGCPAAHIPILASIWVTSGSARPPGASLLVLNNKREDIRGPDRGAREQVALRSALDMIVSAG